MTDQDAHAPTDREQAIYDALNAGDQDVIDRMHDEALGINAPAAPGPGAPEVEEPPPPEPTPAEEFERDHAAAHARHQADHEAPEPARIAATREQVERENAAAARVQEGMG